MYGMKRKRKPMGRKASKRDFSRNGSSQHRLNSTYLTVRGGTRL